MIIWSRYLSSAVAILLVAAAMTASLGAQRAQATELSPVAPLSSCESLAGTQSDAGGIPVRITSARVVSADVPAPYCEVSGYVAPQVKFQLRLPMQNWHQRLLYTGCGGFCGAIQTGVGAAEGCKPVTNGEFAMVASNMGHDSPSNSDTVWASGSAQGRLDWGHRAVHVVTLAAKQIITKFYGQAPRYSYFSGCSDGGREAMMEAQTYPSDFNGIVAGAPVMNVTANNTIYHAWIAQHMLNADGSYRLSADKLSFLHDSVLAKCAGPDTRANGYIRNPLECAFSPRDIACGRSTDTNCLTPAEVGLVAALYRGPTDRHGRALYFGLPKGSELNWQGQAKGSMVFAGSFMTYLARNPSGKAVDVLNAGFTAADLRNYNAYARDLDATSVDLRPFAASGGKLIMWHGWTDVGVPSESSVSYYRALKARLGSAMTEGFMRLYMLPGVNHCGGGAGPDKINALGAMMAWVEDGQAPAPIAARNAKTDVMSSIAPFEP